MNMRYSDCEITEWKIREEIRKAGDAALVDEAMKDILSGKFESNAVHAVMSRGAGSQEDRAKVKDLYDAAALAARHSGAAR